MKIQVKLIGEDSNIFNLIAIVRKEMRKLGLMETAEIMCERIYECKSYEEALNIITEYIEII